MLYLNDLQIFLKVKQNALLFSKFQFLSNHFFPILICKTSGKTNANRFFDTFYFNLNKK